MVSLRVSNCWELKKCQVSTLPATVVPLIVVKEGVVVPDNIVVDGCNVVSPVRHLH